ncbi:MAG: hypothetical protein FRX48_08987 [Lasallia pustulata]|uniref:PH domain-containing protein n=1 Tax=Lasallia pustulata TaxID=136370 RepID=A0A5M8PD81_9LECA|nr:MAG: hypothetical protein FRX48_08987 [Lasallia pustulata]
MSERRRRKSLSIFRPSLTGRTPIHEEGPDSGQAALKKKRRPASFFTPTTPTSPASPSGSELERADSSNSLERATTAQNRPRTLQKSGRPSSIFGSLRSLHSLTADQDGLTRTSSKAASINEAEAGDVLGNIVLHQGEAQTTGGMFRKKNQYLVLTDTHLVRFRSHGRASEMFPTVADGGGRSNTLRHHRMSSHSSHGSLHELHSSSADSHVGIPLNDIVAVYKMDDGRPYFSIEVAYLKEDSNHASALVLQLDDPKESELWLTSIRGAATKARLTNPIPFAQRNVDYVARALEQDRDYDPSHFRMFRVVKRSLKSGGRSSSDDLGKLSSNICYLVIGLHKIHLVPLPKSSRFGSSTSISDLHGSSHGITTLNSLTIQSFDDAFQLSFRLPLRQAASLYLASSSVADIAIWVRQATEYLRPQWIEQPFTWNVPLSFEDELLPVNTEGEDHQCFDRTLTAYCAGYEVDPSNIRYAVNYLCEDAPAFELLAPAHPRRSKYTVLELLAVMRALRYNETFHSISFSHVNMDTLHGLYDKYGSEHIAFTTRSGMDLKLPDQEKACLLVQEIQGLALKSRRLRRMDFSYCLTRKPVDNEESRDSGCTLCEALFPLCAKQLTNVDWIVLNGVWLADADIDYIYAAAIEKSCHFRAVDIGHCGLKDRSMHTILQGMLCQEDTLESIDISDNHARLNPKDLKGYIDRFRYIRKINFSRVNRTSGPEPFMAPGTLLAWKLEVLQLSGTTMNEQTVDAIAAYLVSPQSNTLRELHLNQCQLTGKDMAVLLHAMNRTPGKPRNLHLYVNENRLEQDHEFLVAAVEHSRTPTQMTMRMLEYSDEHCFQALIEALAKNTTTKYLDISKVSLPYDAGDDTCELFQRMLSKNKTLEELDISGEQAHLEVARFGIGLNHALTGLKHNSTLRVLHIEHQKLGLQGASTLAAVLEENTSLQEIYCEHNEINLQAFTVLVNSLMNNTSLLYLPTMDSDRAWSLKKIEREADRFRKDAATVASPIPNKATVRRTIGAAIGGARSVSRGSTEKVTSMLGYTEQDVQAAVRSLSERWDYEVVRLQGLMARNYKIRNGIPLDLMDSNDEDRPGTAASLSTALQAASLDRTPTLEMDVQLGVDEGVDGEGAGSADGSEDEGEFAEKLINVDEEEKDESAGALMMAKELVVL